MAFQFIKNSEGDTTGVFIPIEEWIELKNKYEDLAKQEVNEQNQLTDWQISIVEDRLGDYYKNPNNLVDFDKAIKDLSK